MTFMSSIKSYMRFTRHYYYSVLLVVPLLIVYEIGIVWLHRTHGLTTRNLLDYVTKTVIQAVGSSGFFVISVLLLFLIIVLIRPKKEFLFFHPYYYVVMMVESLCYAVIFSALIMHVSKITFAIGHVGVPGFILSLGAGLYEELFFRVIVFSGLSFILIKAGKLPLTLSTIIAAIISSVVFSLTHYYGRYGDTFTLYSFVFRMIGGLFFCTIYKMRGFALSVYTHALYDIFIAFDIFE